jgi:hypothetical protein
MDVKSATALCTLLHCLISMTPDIGPITRNHLFELLAQVEEGVCKHDGT